jgi:hypothetical protein
MPQIQLLLGNNHQLVSLYNSTLLANFGWSILYHVVKALTMTKIANIYMKIENDASHFGPYIKKNIEKKIVKELYLITNIENEN